MSMRSRLLAVVVSLLLPGLALVGWSLRIGQFDRVDVSLPEIPPQVGPWELGDTHRLDPLESEMLQPDAYMMQRYDAPGRSSIWIYVAVYGGRASYGRGAHDPQVCYPAQGWDILTSDSITISVPEGETLQARLLETQNARLKEAVLFWFQPAGRWPARENAEQLIRVIDAIRGQPQYAFVRLSAASGRKGAAADLLEFAERVAWPIRIALTAPEVAGSEASTKAFFQRDVVRPRPSRPASAVTFDP